MLLAIDVGNTNIVLALFDQGKVKYHWRLTTNAYRTGDELALALSQLLALHHYQLQDISNVIIASVVPEITEALLNMSKNSLKLAPLVVGREGIKLGIEAVTDNPKEVGADRLVNAVAAKKQYGNNLIIIDFGTATTFDIVNNQGNYAGGVIAPGIHLSIEALHMGTAQLPTIDVAPPEKVIGTNTVSAMQSGIYWGYMAMIEGMVTRIKKEMNHSDIQVIATGGLASLFANGTSMIHYVEEDLTLAGLNIIFELNQ